MATKKTSKPANAVTAEASIPTEEERHVISAQLTLDRLRQNASAFRDPKAWERYQGACELARSFGYAVGIVGERRHVLIKTD